MPNIPETKTLQEDPTKEKRALYNDFFKPISEMDPLSKQNTVDYDFGCELFKMNRGTDRLAYQDVVKKCLNGTYLQGVKQTHFTKDGDMYIYLEWTIRTVTSNLQQGPAPKKSETPATKKESKHKDEKAAAKFSSHIVEEPTLPLEPPLGLETLMRQDDKIEDTDTVYEKEYEVTRDDVPDFDSL